MCGIAGIHSQNNVASDLFDCLVHLQHRGQDAAGIMTYEDTHMHKAKGMGLARDVFNEKKCLNFKEKLELLITDIQPMVVLDMEKFNPFGQMFLMELH